ELAKTLLRRGSLFPEDLANRKPFTKQGYGSVKRVYIYGEDDLFFPKEIHLWQIQNFPPHKVYFVAGGDRKLMFSKPRLFSDCLLDIAGHL
ncbi:(S)-hydroxynitrile lyase, partial [Linum perenne]